MKKKKMVSVENLFRSRKFSLLFRDLAGMKVLLQTAISSKKNHQIEEVLSINIITHKG